MKHPRVAIIILNWNGRYFLEKFLPSVYNSTYPNLEFIVGDNGSTDDSVDFVRKYYPQIKVLLNDENYGFADGYNRVIAQAPPADYYVLLNSDVEVTPTWIEPMVRFLEMNPDYAAAQPKILAWHKRNIFEHAGAAGGYIDRWGYPFCRGRILDQVESDTGQYDNPAEVFWASGASFMIRRTCWEETGGFDPSFFAHMEEIDLCWRLKRLGYRIACCPEARVYHVGGGTLQKENPLKTYLNFRNNLWMLQKNLPGTRVYAILFLRLWLDLFALIKFLLAGHFRDALAVHKAHLSFFRHFFRVHKSRKKQASVPDKTFGIYKGSILWSYFIKRKRKFSELTKSFQ